MSWLGSYGWLRWRRVDVDLMMGGVRCRFGLIGASPVDIACDHGWDCDRRALVRIGVLGAVEVFDDGGGDVVVTSVIQRRLVAMLVVWRGSIVSAERLADVWGVSVGALRTTASPNVNAARRSA